VSENKPESIFMKRGHKQSLAHFGERRFRPALQILRTHF